MLKDEALAIQILECIETLLEAAQYMLECATAKNYGQIELTGSDMKDMIQSLYPLVQKIKEEIPFISAPVTCENLIFSINNIFRFLKTRSDKGISKIQFELIPIIQEFYYDFYFFTCIFGNKDKEQLHYAQEFVQMGINSYTEESMQTNQYKYDVSIYVLAYNKLEYTKQCIESILKFTPSYVNYELFFINNGSSDHTQEYFDSLQCNKGITLLKNSFADIRASRRICEGRYVLSISNDVVVTENYLDNLIKCIESDPQIAMVVPTTPNISNYQTIPAEYSSIEEMHAFAKANNISDPSRWEERTRLCNPLSLYRSDVLFSSRGIGSIDRYFVYSEFGDDALALRLRRAGYKMVLAKDCFCHHFGSVTLKEAQVKENTLEKSRKLFMERHGVDAWSIGFCYDEKFIQSLAIKAVGQVNILGINSGFGSNPLKIKTIHKEAGNQDIGLYNVTDDERYILDLDVYSTEVIHAKDNAIDAFDNISFDYILLESNIEQILQMPKSFDTLRSKLSKAGILAICAVNDKDVELLKKYNADKTIQGITGYWYCWTN
ncbi:glycosyltransferase family 2 protein [Paenibacillus sp. TAB 01]|uniref:glycosyltransferase family 2 protein n=1 Tax=Paenibacillus sp. TAB 01 TaxID=3368988 RepID=UPI003750405B